MSEKKEQAAASSGALKWGKLTENLLALSSRVTLSKKEGSKGADKALKAKAQASH